MDIRSNRSLTQSRNDNLSHITAGFIYSSPTQKKIRADQAYDGVLGSSLFDFGNTTQDGVANTLWELKPAINSPPEIWQGFVQPTFPILSPDFLIQLDAVFAGHIVDPFIPYAGNLTKVSGLCMFAQLAPMADRGEVLVVGVVIQWSNSRDRAA